MKQFMILGALVLLFGPLFGCKKRVSTASATIVYVVRHAEKVKDGTRNPSLRKVGYQRARALRRMLHSVPLHAVYATEFKRTQETVASTANAKRLPVKILPAKDLKKLIALIKGQYKGKSILISGHSNTVPAMIKALGLPFTVRLKEKTDYDNLFVVTLRDGYTPTYLRFHFGPLPPRP